MFVCPAVPQMYIHCDDFAEYSGIESRFCILRDKKKYSLSLSTSTVTSESECVLKCMTTESCAAVNYYISTEACELGTADQDLLAGELVHAEGVVHYSKFLCQNEGFCENECHGNC